MVHLKQKVLIGLLVVDALIAIGMSLNSTGSSALRGWLWLIAIIIGISLAIFIGLKLRRRRTRYSRKYRARYGRGLQSQDIDEYHSGPQVTLDGTVVKSAGERLIADYFHEHRILYEYERPARDLTNRRISRPDFYLPDYDIYVEYWGMVNTKEHHKRQEYIKSMGWKMARYHENGLKFISIYPENLGKLDSIFQSKLHK